MERDVLSVAQLNAYVKALMSEDALLSQAAVRGELSNYKIYPSGHHYFTLKDETAALKCVMFKWSAQRLRFRPENGMRVTVFGRIEVYERDGVYQLNASAIVPEGTGDLQIAFEQLKEKLSAEGLFDARYKKPLPKYPKTIAIITSGAGAALHDMLRILAARWPMTKVKVLPVRVQGAEAPAEIAGALRYANAFRVADLIITGRGGGSIEDLWAFNDERVARAIFESEIPVISAVGHEPDVTISDFVADRRASTPSNAAEIAVPDWREEQLCLEQLRLRLSREMTRQLARRRDRLDALRQKRVLQDASAQIDHRRLRVDSERLRLLRAQENRIAREKQRFVRNASMLDAISPLRVLLRGYAIAGSEEGHALRSVREVKKGELLSVRLSDGTLRARVEQIEEIQ